MQLVLHHMIDYYLLVNYDTQQLDINNKSEEKGKKWRKKEKEKKNNKK